MNEKEKKFVPVKERTKTKLIAVERIPPPPYSKNIERSTMIVNQHHDKKKKNEISRKMEKSKDLGYEK